MTTTNWLDLAFLAILLAYFVVFTLDVWKRRHRHCEIRVQTGMLRSITVSGASPKEAVWALEEVRLRGHLRHDGKEPHRGPEPSSVTSGGTTRAAKPHSEENI